MWKKFNFLCTIIISGTVGAFLGYSIYVCWEHKTQRDLDVLTSFPWYSGIQLFGIVAAVIIIIAVILKLLIRKKSR